MVANHPKLAKTEVSGHGTFSAKIRAVPLANWDGWSSYKCKYFVFRCKLNYKEADYENVIDP